jgi:hypothetical protein
MSFLNICDWRDSMEKMKRDDTFIIADGSFFLH